jgi:hypothetical protein
MDAPTKFCPARIPLTSQRPIEGSQRGGAMYRKAIYAFTRNYCNQAVTRFELQWRFLANHMQVVIFVTASSASGHFSRVPLGH